MGNLSSKPSVAKNKDILNEISRSSTFALAHVTVSKGKVLDHLWSRENDPKTSLNPHQSLYGKILPNFDMNNISVALKLIMLEEISPFHLDMKGGSSDWLFIIDHLLMYGSHACIQNLRTIRRKERKEEEKSWPMKTIAT